MDLNKGETIVKLLVTHPPLQKELGRLLTSIETFESDTTAESKGSNSPKKFPWVRVGSSLLGDILLELLSEKSKKRMTGYILQSECDVDQLDPDCFEVSEQQKGLQIEHGLKYSAILEWLEKSGWTRVKRVWSEGEYSLIGESVAVWPSGFEYPMRIEFEDDGIGRIGVLDINTWRVIREEKQLYLEGDPGIDPESDPGRDPGDDQNRNKTIGDCPCGKEVDQAFVKVVKGISFENMGPKKLFFAETGILPDELQEYFNVLDFGIFPTKWNEALVRNRLENGWNVFLVSDEKSVNVEEIKKGFPGISIVKDVLQRGFEIEAAKVMVLSDLELWGTVQLSSDGSRGMYRDLILDEVHPGEYVVHEDHGIGRYAGMETIEKDGEERLYLELKYAQKDRLLVPLAQVKKITKYVGVGNKEPKLTRLGGGEWRRVKKRVTKAVRELAGELLRLYAVREMTKVSPLKDDSIDISEFEKDFEFVETDDQLGAIDDIKEDLRGERPMDRVLVGDVGFGKTEVAMRAAYMTVRGGKQVAVLAPTTVLVEQHNRIFRDRFEKHGILVGSLSRFLKPSEAADVVSRIKKGQVDVVVGTHRLLSADVSFKNLGMVIIDEEQKFGVSQKERLKNMRVDTHVLSMSATPIPRTLNMALAGVRDISVIATPPEGRKSIKNIVKKFNWDIVKDAINKEKKRNGQVYYVHNRVSTIGTVKEKMSELLPDVRIGIGHGQMPSSRLSRVVRDFHNGKYDVLLCTTIIENGLDMPNVNTLIVDRAEMFGLSQLYQIRGRVGRGLRKAYAYFLYHGSMGGRFVKKRMLERISEESGADAEFEEAFDYGVSGTNSKKTKVSKEILWEEARQRLDAIAQLEKLGSGFALAQRDLEIRGAGSFLGRDQHGNVGAVGFSLYCRLLDEMVRELKKE